MTLQPPQCVRRWAAPNRLVALRIAGRAVGDTGDLLFWRLTQDGRRDRGSAIERLASLGKAADSGAVGGARLEADIGIPVDGADRGSVRGGNSVVPWGHHRDHLLPLRRSCSRAPFHPDTGWVWLLRASAPRTMDVRIPSSPVVDPSLTVLRRRGSAHVRDMTHSLPRRDRTGDNVRCVGKTVPRPRGSSAVPVSSLRPLRIRAWSSTSRTPITGAPRRRPARGRPAPGPDPRWTTGPTVGAPAGRARCPGRGRRQCSGSRHGR